MTKDSGYKICSRCVMDNTDPDIQFDQETGFCNHCTFHFETAPLKLLPFKEREEKLISTIEMIKDAGKGKKYDCIMGLSGGVDSSYVATLAKKYGLRPLAIHLDNGWNSELAVNNIHNIVEKLGLDLHTHVINWNEFQDLQRSFIKASVVDIELLTDHAITAIIYKMAKKFGVKYILSGSNFNTESIMPATWYHRKSDLKNLLDIHDQFGKVKLKTFPKLSTLDLAQYTILRGIKQVHILNLINYNKDEAIQFLTDNIGWRNYKGKHHESIFTRYYQTYILPEKFNIDKRKCHYSSLICSGQITRSEALEALKIQPYSKDEIEAEGVYIAKKLGFSKKEFEDYIKTPPKSHYDYKSDQFLYDLLNKYRKYVQELIKA